MPTYVPVDSGTVVKGQIRFTSYYETAQSGEIGQLLVFDNYNWDKTQLFCIRKVVLPFVAGQNINDYPLLLGSDIEVWSPTTFFPVSGYYPGGTTLLYFPERLGLPVNQPWRLLRVVQ